MEYNSSAIQILEGLEPVRKRPGMYIGSTDITGLHHLVWEIIDNSVDEALAGYCKNISIIINKDSSVSIEDDGRGIPVDIHPKTNKSAVETVFTILHAGGKFNTNTYKVSGGLHGVGSSVVNALSSHMTVEVYKNGKVYTIKFNNGGKVQMPLTITGKSKKTGTKVWFMPDWDIFDKNIDFVSSYIIEKAKQTAFLNKKLKLRVKDERQENPEFYNFYYENGIKDYLKEIYLKDEKISGIKNISDIYYCDYTWEDINFEIGFQYNDSSDYKIFSFCNNILTQDGGTHLEGLQQALLKSFNNFIKNKSKKDFKLIWEDLQEGINLIISIKHQDPIYQGQTKDRLVNAEIKKIIINNFVKKINTYLLENPIEAKKIVDKLYISYRARIAAKNAREYVVRKSITDEFSLPGKLADCESKNPDETEIYIVEGDSAGGSAKLGRNRKYQAILPLRGKVINVEKATKAKIFANNEIKTIITALGTGILSKFNIRTLRYKKIIIMTDADVDGAHIKILLLTFFYRFMKSIIEEGNIYIAQPPLYKIKYGNNIKYLFSDEELESEKLIAKSSNLKLQIQRYKGLGEMNPKQLWNTTMDPNNRSLVKISINNTFSSNEVFERLMGNEVESRKQYINENAKFVRNLDI